MDLQKSVAHRKALLALAFLVGCAGLVIFHKPLIIGIARKNFSAVFPGADVTIGDCRFAPAGLLVLQNINIKKEKIYALTLRELRVEYTLASLARRVLEKVSVNGLLVSITTPRAPAQTLGRYLALKPAGFLTLEKLAVSQAQVSLVAQDLRLEARVSFDIDVARQRLDRASLTLDTLAAAGFGITQAHCLAVRDNAGKIFIKQIKFDKLKIEEASAAVRLSDSEIAITDVTARIFDGRLSGDALIDLGGFAYTADLRFAQLDAQVLTEDLEMEEKFKMSGRWAGSLALAGRGADVSFFDSNLGVLAPGGNLEIVDKKFLEDTAARTQVPADILVERFRDYHYNKGAIDLSLEGTDVVAGIILDGEKGKSNFKIHLHDFLKTVLKQT